MEGYWKDIDKAVQRWTILTMEMLEIFFSI